jgi:hypothetical protein
VLGKVQPGTYVSSVTEDAVASILFFEES